MGSEDYLARIDSALHSAKLNEFKAGYKELQKKGSFTSINDYLTGVSSEDKSNFLSELQNAQSITPGKYGATHALANNLLKRASKMLDLQAAYESAKMYSAMGEIGRDSVQRRLVGAIEARATKSKDKFSSAEKEYIIGIKSLIRHSPSSNNTAPLEKILAASTFIGLVSGAFFFSTKITGNVIGFSNGTSSIIGAVLLVIGFVAGYFWAKGRKGSKRK